MAQELFTIDISSGGLDNEYTFYDDGMVKRNYDASMYNLNKTETSKASELNDSVKKKLIAACDVQYLSHLEAFL